MEWLLGNDQSPVGGHSEATMTASAKTRQGRSWSTITLRPSLAAYAMTTPMPAAPIRAQPGAPRPRYGQAATTKNRASRTIESSVKCPMDHCTHSGVEFAQSTMSRYHSPLISGTSSPGFSLTMVLRRLTAGSDDRNARGWAPGSGPRVRSQTVQSISKERFASPNW